MDFKRKINELELRIFTLEKNNDLMEEKINQLKESLDFYYEENEKDQEQIDRENLLDTKEACEVLNIAEIKLNEWVRKNLVKEIIIANTKYYDKEELRTQFRKMKINNT